MSTNDGDFQNDQVDFDDIPEDGLEDFEGGGTTLGEMWRNNPLVKIGVIAGGLITIIGAIILFGNNQRPNIPSVIKGGSDVSEAPGGAISETYRNALEEENTARVEEAVRTGQSAIVTPIDEGVSRLNLPDDTARVEDPLERWHRIQEERQRQTAQQQPEVAAPDPYAGAIDQLAQAMATQMQSILSTKTKLKGMEHETITDSDWFEKQREEEEAKKAEAQQVAANEEEVVNILIPAGTIEYAQLIVEANSDMPGPILAHLVSGPLAGAKLIGSFEEENEYLILTFDSIIIDGIAHSTEAVALDPDKTTLGMVTEVDHRYFKRVILPAAASFIEGIGGAIGDAGSTTSVSSSSTTTASPDLNSRQELFTGIEEAASVVSDLVQKEADETKVLVRVASGTPMGLFFTEPVTER